MHGFAVTVSEAFGADAPPALAATWYVPTALTGGVLVRVDGPLAPGLKGSDTGEQLDPQPASDGSAELSVKPRAAHDAESLFSTVTLKLNGDPASTEPLVGENDSVGAACVHGGVL